MANKLKDVHGVKLSTPLPCKSENYNNILIVKDDSGVKYVVHKEDVYPNFERVKPCSAGYKPHHFDLKKSQSREDPEGYLYNRGKFFYEY